MDLSRSRAIARRLRDVIPGGAHTYAKGEDQFPELAPPVIERGEGCRVWDADGNEYIEYGAGLRAVTLGHAFPPVVEAVRRQLSLGSNFTRPAPIELECAEAFLEAVPTAEMVKFTKDGSTATTAAVKLARAHTGRDLVGVCAGQPFFSYDDWFIATTDVDAGIPRAVAELTVSFRYNDLGSVEELFARHPGRVACLILEAQRAEPPAPGFLEGLRAMCTEHGSVLVFDETIAGFRLAIGGGQELSGVVPDLSVFGKGLANGFSVSALAGRRELMELGGLEHDRPRVFLLSTTHGAETHSLAAAIATLRVYRGEPVIETLAARGRKLAALVTDAAADRGIAEHVAMIGPPANLVFAALDADGHPSQAYRALLLQEAARRGVLMPSLVVSYSHGDDALEQTAAALHEAFAVYRRALDEGVEGHLVGPPTRVVYRRHN